MVVLDPAFAASHENNQVIVDGESMPAGLVEVADHFLGHLPHRRITVLDDTVGRACAPLLDAAGYVHEIELIMTYSGPDTVVDERVGPVSLDDLLPAVEHQLRLWMPDAEETVIRHLAGRRTARLRSADQVHFLAARDESGAIASWADVYLDPERQIAQIEDLVTAEAHTRRGYADAVLAAALTRASTYELRFLLAAAADWPRQWYARRGFVEIGRSHVFTRVDAAARAER
ncbi:GNAT family N-acetyltransferase [Kitasatospora sp. NPDC059571]|uniref:GNAT family N-acetyltransferase n=1 Tax=Kitasatospora sp. NPDC059571 TaxID=3346871 RepID=UPI0036AA251D